MAYQIVETPDHLHRGLHVFAVTNLHPILNWLDGHVRVDALRDLRLTTDDRWFLNSLKRRGLSQDIDSTRLLARKEAREFFKQHPEFRSGATYRTAASGRTHDLSEEEFSEESWRDHQDFEFAQVLHGDLNVLHATENLRSAIRAMTVSLITDELESLAELLAESGFHHRFVFEALNVLHGLLAEGANDASSYLDADVDEAFEVTDFCRGRFRKLAAHSIDRLRKMPPVDFEALCAELLAQLGLTEVELTPVVADGGIDIIGFQILDGKRIKYIIQCKRNSLKNKVDVRVVRELAGVKMDAGADRALIITTSDFTKNARDFADETRLRPWGVRLVNHKLLKRLLHCTD